MSARKIEMRMDRLVEHTVTVAVDDFTLTGLEGAGEATPGVLLTRAVRYYLAERDAGRPGWPCSRIPDEGTSITELNVDWPTWEEFSREADRQKVSTDQLLQHAALYYLADRDSGRLTQRILEDLEETP